MAGGRHSFRGTARAFLQPSRPGLACALDAPWRRRGNMLAGSATEITGRSLGHHHDSAVDEPGFSRTEQAHPSDLIGARPTCLIDFPV